MEENNKLLWVVSIVAIVGIVAMVLATGRSNTAAQTVGEGMMTEETNRVGLAGESVKCTLTFEGGYSTMSCADGYMQVCDMKNNRCFVCPTGKGSCQLSS